MANSIAVNLFFITSSGAVKVSGLGRGFSLSFVPGGVVPKHRVSPAVRISRRQPMAILGPQNRIDIKLNKLSRAWEYAHRIGVEFRGRRACLSLWIPL